jgi:hypothetical protein
MKIKQILAPTNLPVELRYYEGEADAYITFFELDQFGLLSADDKEVETGRDFQIDIYSRDDYVNIVDQVYDLMTAAGFRRTMSMDDEYAKESGFYRRVMRFRISEEE